ncbi:flavodoxin family protein [Candidatus Bathyarchaeota archaeon]|nr:flavodoxin family protein [Candidatus Bathyarchaeota archaeon]
MKRVTAFVGSARKKSTYNAVRQFLDNLQSLGDVECEIVALSDHRLGTCRGCKLCFEKGEEFCPLKDDRDVLIEKLMVSDGVVFASPNYSFQVSAMMKIFLDRLGFIFHRPRFFGKTFTSIVAQGIYGGGKIVRYLDFVGNGLGFNTVKGTCFTALEPMTVKEKQKIDRALARQSRRFYERLIKPVYPVPTLFKLMAFRMGRTSIGLELDERSRDYRYYKDKGWFESDYFYSTRLGALKKIAGSLFDSIARHRGASSSERDKLLKSL